MCDVSARPVDKQHSIVVLCVTLKSNVFLHLLQFFILFLNCLLKG